MAAAETLQVEIVYALPQQQTLLSLTVPAGTTVAEAIKASGIEQRHSEIDLAQCALGVFGRLAEAGQPLVDGDRVEIYRPLQVDPKTARRARAAKDSQHANTRRQAR